MDQELYDKLYFEKVVSSNGKTLDARAWTLQEQSDFIDLLLKHGRDYRMISKKLKTRTEFACKNKAKIAKQIMKNGGNPFDEELQDKVTRDLIFRLVVEKRKYIKRPEVFHVTVKRERRFESS